MADPKSTKDPLAAFMVTVSLLGGALAAALVWFLRLAA
jgi:hypothetical protein